MGEEEKLVKIEPDFNDKLKKIRGEIIELP